MSTVIVIVKSGSQIILSFEEAYASSGNILKRSTLEIVDNNSKFHRHAMTMFVVGTDSGKARWTRSAAKQNKKLNL